MCGLDEILRFVRDSRAGIHHASTSDRSVRSSGDGDVECRSRMLEPSLARTNTTQKRITRQIPNR